MIKEKAVLSKKDRQKELDKLLSDLSKKFEDTPIAPVTKQPTVEVKTISTGSFILDKVLGGGFPVGRIIEIFGENASGKTSFALNAIADVQKKGGKAVFLDVEQAFDPKYAKTLGVNLDELIFAQPDFAEDTLSLVKSLCLSGLIDLIVVDSVAALVPKVESEQDFEKSSVGVLARLLSKSLKQIISVANKNGCTVIFLNQMREKIGVLYGDNRETVGGKALKYFASQRLEVARKGKKEEDGVIIGNEIRFKCIKNKIAPPYSEGLTVLTFAKGVNKVGEVVVLGEELGVLEKIGRTTYFQLPKGTKYTLPKGSNASIDKDGKIKIGTSADATYTELNTNTSLFQLISEELIKAMNEKQGLTPPPETDDDIDLSDDFEEDEE